MKDTWRLLAGLVLGLVIGWTLGFLRLPYLEANYAFGLGFVAALALAALVLLLLSARRTGAPARQGVGGRGLALTGLLVLGGLALGAAGWRQYRRVSHALQNRDTQLQHMSAVVTSMRQNEALLSSVLDDVSDELKRQPGRTLRDTTIARIAALSFSFTPYQSVEADTLSARAYSPERGRLLQALVLLQIDTGSFNRIKQRTLFAGADLRGADLKGMDLGGIDLRGANLRDADLQGASLQGADLGEANLWGANLNRADVSRANLKRAELSWAQLNDAILRGANLNGAHLASAQLRQADLYDAWFQWTQSVGVLLNDANLASVDFLGSNLSRANLRGANLWGANLSKAVLKDADVTGARLHKTFVDLNWPQKVQEWQPLGAGELQVYTVVNDTFNQWKDPLYRLIKN